MNRSKGSQPPERESVASIIRVSGWARSAPGSNSMERKSISMANTTPGVLVTGGGQRLGAAVCTAFARAGWRVWCQYKSSRDAAEALCAGLRQAGHQADA